MMASAKSWDDQPAVVAGAEVLCTLSLGAKLVEVRKLAPIYYVTIGTLWGSETVACDSAEVVFKVLQICAAQPDKPVNVPKGATVVER